MKILAIASILTVVVAAGQSLDDCLQSDSISCVQKSLYRKAKEFFDKDSLELFTGVSLVRNERSQGRSSRSGKELMYEQEIDSANSVTDRQAALENFVSEEAGELLTGRSLRVNRITFTSCESPLSPFILNVLRTRSFFLFADQLCPRFREDRRVGARHFGLGAGRGPPGGRRNRRRYVFASIYAQI